MRDGVKLFTSIYTPRTPSRAFAILLRRTPYSCRPYGADEFPRRPAERPLHRRRYAFAIQDSARYMSEASSWTCAADRAQALEVRRRRIERRVDTVDWLVKNVAGNNGTSDVGISYPGFYAAAGMIDAHPALKAVSPQLRSRLVVGRLPPQRRAVPAALLPVPLRVRPARPEPVRARVALRRGTRDGYGFFSRSASRSSGRSTSGRRALLTT